MADKILLTLSQTSPCFYVSAAEVSKFENTVGKGEIAHNEQFLLFPQCFLSGWRTLCHLHQIWNCYLQNLSVCRFNMTCIWKSRAECCIPAFLSFPMFSKAIFVRLVNLFPNKPGFLRVCTSSPFLTVFSTRFKDFLPFSSNLKLSSANTLNLKGSIICCLGKG